MQTEAFEIVEVSLSFFEVFAVLLNGLESITVARIHFPLKRLPQIQKIISFPLLIHFFEL